MGKKIKGKKKIINSVVVFYLLFLRYEQLILKKKQRKSQARTENWNEGRCAANLNCISPSENKH